MCPKQVEASFYAFVLAVINLGYLVSYQLGGILTYSLGITATQFERLWILVVLSAIFPLLTQILLLCLPEKYDVNEEITKYFQKRKNLKQKAQDILNINMDSAYTGSIRLKTNIRDEIEEDDCLIDKEIESSKC